MTNEYDARSAVTFLLVGLGIGAVLAVVLGTPPRRSNRLVTRQKVHLGVNGLTDIVAPRGGCENA